MAKQEGPLKLNGTLEDLNFYKSKTGYKVRMKGGVSRNRVKTDPAFQRTRENGAEFARAARSGKMLRNALRPLLQKAQDSGTVTRLASYMLRALQADITSARGLRNVVDGDLTLLSGFEFNQDGLLSTTLFVPYTTTINRATGQLTIDLPAFVPSSMIKAAQGATHFKIISAGTEVDFSSGITKADYQESGALPINNVATAPLQLVHSVTANSTHSLFLVLGIQFMQQMNANLYPLSNSAFNALAIVGIDQ